MCKQLLTALVAMNIIKLQTTSNFNHKNTPRHPGAPMVQPSSLLKVMEFH